MPLSKLICALIGSLMKPDISIHSTLLASEMVDVSGLGDVSQRREKTLYSHLEIY